MITDKNTGGPAFPYQEVLPDGFANLTPQRGMTLRDYFAAKAIVGHLADGGWKCDQSHFDDVAKGAYRLADAMLKAREVNND
jgi:hypothetical protein